jgi:hypothetical protein
MATKAVPDGFHSVTPELIVKLPERPLAVVMVSDRLNVIALV